MSVVEAHLPSEETLGDPATFSVGSDGSVEALTPADLTEFRVPGLVLLDRSIFGDELTYDEHDELGEWAFSEIEYADSPDDAIDQVTDIRLSQIAEIMGETPPALVVDTSDEIDVDSLGYIPDDLKEHYARISDKYAKAKNSSMNGTRGQRKLAKVRAEFEGVVSQIERLVKTNEGYSEEQASTAVALNGANRVSREEERRLTESWMSRGLNAYANRGFIARAAIASTIGLGGVLFGGAVLGGGLIIVSRFGRGLLNKSSENYRGAKDQLAIAYEAKRARQASAIRDASGSSAAELISLSELDSAEISQAKEHRGRNRKAIAFAVGTIAAGRALGWWVNRDAIAESWKLHKTAFQDHMPKSIRDHLPGRPRPTVDAPPLQDALPTSPPVLDVAGDGSHFDTFDGFAVRPGETQEHYFTRFWNHEMTSTDQHDWGRMMEYAEQHPDVDMANALERASAGAGNLSDEATSRLGSALDSLQSVADASDALDAHDALISSARIGELEQWFAGGGHNQADVFYQFNALEQIYGAPYMDALHSNSGDLFQNPLLRKTLSDWYQINH